MDLKKLTQGERIVLIAGVLLIIDLLFLPWHSVETAFGDFTRQAIEDPNGFYGVIALLLTIVMVAQVAAAKLGGVKMPDLPIGWGQIHLIAGVAVLALLVLKLVVETDALGFGCYLGIALAAAVAYGGFSINKESGARTF